MYYQFKISSENLPPTAQQIVAPLKKLLALPLLDQFVAQLEKMTHPEHRFKDWLEHVKVRIDVAKGCGDGDKNIVLVM